MARPIQGWARGAETVTLIIGRDLQGDWQEATANKGVGTSCGSRRDREGQDCFEACPRCSRLLTHTDQSSSFLYFTVF